MKKNPKRIAAIIALVAIALLLIAFVVSAFTADAGEAGSRFMGLLFCIIAIPLLAWVLIFCIGRMRNKHTMAELFPEHEDGDKAAAESDESK